MSLSCVRRLLIFINKFKKLSFWWKLLLITFISEWELFNTIKRLRKCTALCLYIYKSSHWGFNHVCAVKIVVNPLFLTRGPWDSNVCKKVNNSFKNTPTAKLSSNSFNLLKVRHQIQFFFALWKFLEAFLRKFKIKLMDRFSIFVIGKYTVKYHNPREDRREFYEGGWIKP